MSSTTRRQRKLRDKRLGRNRHRARKPGTVRHTRLPGGNGYRGKMYINDAGQLVSAGQVLRV